MAAHEATHMMKVEAAAEYKAYEDYVIQNLKDSSAYEDMIKEYQDRIGSKDLDLLHEEIVADSTETFLSDPDKFVEFAKKDTPAARKLIEVVTKLIDKLKETVKKLTPNGKAAKLLQEDIDTYEEAKDLWYQGIESIMEKNAKEDKVQDTTSDIADQRYSIKEIPDTIKEDVMENRKTVANMNPIAELKDTLFEKGEKTLSEQVLHFFNECGNNAYNAVVGDVELSKKGIDDDIAHGMGRAKAITYAAVPQVIEEGKIIDYQSNWKNRGYDTIVFAAPIKITGEYLEAVIARRFNGQKAQRFYVHEALSIEKEKLAVLDQEAKSIVDPGDKSLNIYTLLHNTLKYKWEDEKNNYKFSMKDEKKDNISQKDSSQAAVNKLDGVRFSIKDFDNPEYYTYDNLISLPDMQIENSKMDIVSKDTSRADIRERAFENIQNSKYGRRDGNKCFIKNKYLGDVMITKDSIRHIIVKINENRMIAALNIAKYLPESIVINQTDGARKGANKSYVLLGMMEDGTNQYILRTVLNSYENEYEVSDANVVYSVASKKNQPAYFSQGLGNKSMPSTGSHALSIKDFLKTVNNYFPNELSKDIHEHFETNRKKSEIEGLRYSLKDEEGISLYNSKEDDFAWMEDILKEEPGIKETASILQEGTEALQKAKKAPDSAAVRKISKSILEDIGSQYDLDTFSDNLEKVFSYMQSEDNVSYDDMVRVMTEVAWHELVVARREKDPVDIAYREKKNIVKRTLICYNRPKHKSNTFFNAKGFQALSKFLILSLELYAFHSLSKQEF